MNLLLYTSVFCSLLVFLSNLCAILKYIFLSSTHPRIFYQNSKCIPVTHYNPLPKLLRTHHRLSIRHESGPTALRRERWELNCWTSQWSWNYLRGARCASETWAEVLLIYSLLVWRSCLCEQREDKEHENDKHSKSNPEADDNGV